MEAVPIFHRDKAYSGIALTQMLRTCFPKKRKKYSKFFCFGKQNLCSIATSTLLFISSPHSFLAYGLSITIRFKEQKTVRKNPKPDGSDTKYSVQRDCINPIAKNLLSKKKKKKV
jgi:hypothetical protein